MLASGWLGGMVVGAVRVDCLLVTVLPAPLPVAEVPVVLVVLAMVVSGVTRLELSLVVNSKCE